MQINIHEHRDNKGYLQLKASQQASSLAIVVYYGLSHSTPIGFWIMVFVIIQLVILPFSRNYYPPKHDIIQFSLTSNGFKVFPIDIDKLHLSIIAFIF